jgi:phage baseplate assembly protein gpV
MLSYSITANDETGTANVALYLGGQVFQARSDHPSYPAIIAGLLANDGKGDESVDYAALFSAERAIASKFEVLSERVSVKNGEVYLDGDIVHGSLQKQIVAFLEAGEDFEPLVRFYEKLLGNPLGNVQDGVYDWAQANGLTINDEGNLLGYKSVHSTEGGYRPSRASATGEDRVNGQEVGVGNDIIQNIGDVVEMPRSIVLNEPSRACAEGLHVGTFDYAKGFQGDTVLLVEFNPRDIVSLPDSNSAWKLRVCRYTVVSVVDEALSAPVFHTEVPAGIVGHVPVLDEESIEGIVEGTRVQEGGDLGTVVDLDPANLEVLVEWDEEAFDQQWVAVEDLDAVLNDNDTPETPEQTATRRKHGKGGRHSKAAEGRGPNPRQNPKTGQFTHGRPDSQRDPNTGRFIG